MNGRQFIYHMEGLSKTYPNGKKVLENIHLSFYPDAKIGVLGVNGSGKSTLLRIMAGIDTEYVGEGFVAEGARVGYLEQEPHLDETKTVRENVMEGVAGKRALLERYNEIASNYSDDTAEEMSKLGYFAHQSPTPGRTTPYDRMRLAGYDKGASENIALVDGAQGAHDAWSQSSGHHRNLLDPGHHEAGIGNDGRYWVQNFGRGTVYLESVAWDQAEKAK